ncbi:MAG: T9SS type A sorting domain-containing protein [Ignavibacteria bacterium]|nr:T9SS type A sorting domain-containing protein [Ignavibacteria bacterium]
MKISILIVLLFLCINSINSQPQNIEAEAKEPGNISESYNFNGNYNNSVFLNFNLSQNSNPQNEPSIHISRANSNFVVAAWRDFRLGYIEPNIVRRIGYSYSTNGGLSWAAPQLLPDPNPNHTSQSDPVITSDAQGNFYISSTSRQPVANYNRDMLLYKSTNNGQTFFLHSIAVPGSGGAGEDKEWIFCDPVTTNSTYNNIFISWTSFGPSPGIRFRKSTNGGLNWSATVNVGDNTAGQGSNICSGTNNQIYMVWDQGGVRFDRSTNGGTSFGTDLQLSNVNSTNGFPYITCDYSNNSTRGNVYVVWDDMRGGNSDVYFQRSTNGGINWLASPVRINDVTTNNQYWPMIKCDNNGNLFVIYYDTRTGTSSINAYVAYSTDAGNTWVNTLMSDSSFTQQQPNSDVRFGDYIGIDAYDGKVIPVWTDQRKGYPDQEIYTANLSGLIFVSPVSTEIPVRYELYQNYPNPFNPVTKIRFDLPASAFTKIVIFDALGREVKTVFSQNLSAGKYETEYNGSNLSSGIYFYTITSGDFIETKKMLIIK